jgi:hypothetical protein
VTCSACGASISDKEMEKDLMGGLFADMLSGGVGAYTTPNVMQGLAMKCNQCGDWICSRCAQRTAMSAGAGAIQHSNCGGMFETPH